VRQAPRHGFGAVLDVACAYFTARGEVPDAPQLIKVEDPRDHLEDILVREKGGPADAFGKALEQDSR